MTARQPSVPNLIAPTAETLPTAPHSASGRDFLQPRPDVRCSAPARNFQFFAETWESAVRANDEFREFGEVCVLPVRPGWSRPSGAPGRNCLFNGKNGKFGNNGKPRWNSQVLTCGNPENSGKSDVSFRDSGVRMRERTSPAGCRLRVGAFAADADAFMHFGCGRESTGRSTGRLMRKLDKMGQNAADLMQDRGGAAAGYSGRLV